MQRNAISAFTRVSDAPSARLCASLTRYGGSVLRRRSELYIAHILSGFVGPGSAEQREDAAPCPGHMARMIPAPHTHAIVSGKRPSAARFLKSVVFKSFTLFRTFPYLPPTK
jgi:hypothetical protein